MLARLAIRDFAVVAHAELEFGPGMTVISGETGAGKSLLVDALGFLSGLRADSGMVRHGADRAELVAEFTLDDAPAPVSPEITVMPAANSSSAWATTAKSRMTSRVSIGEL